MTQYKFMRKNLSKYKSSLLTSIYGLTSESSKGVKDYIIKESTKKNIDGEIIDVTEQLTRELEVNAKDIANPEIIPEAKGELREIVNTEILKSDELEIVVDREFPNIVQYKIGDNDH